MKLKNFWDHRQGLNLDEKALDVEDFMRMAYSHPNVNMILLWSWIHKTTFSEKAMFEGKIGTNAEPLPEVCDEFDPVCNYPYNPNKGFYGVKFLLKKYVSGSE